MTIAHAGSTTETLLSESRLSNVRDNRGEFTFTGIEAPCSTLQGIFDPQGSIIYFNRSLNP